MDQHLVHDDLEEERADEREELEKQGDDQHLTEQATVFHEARHEPAEIELGKLSGETGATRHEDQQTAPSLGEGDDRFNDRPAALNRAQRILKEHSLAVALR